MKDVSLVGILEEQRITLLHANLTKADEGKPCKISANQTVSLCADGDEFVGIISIVETNACSVQVTGSIELPYTGTDPALNKAGLLANGAGGVKADANATKYRSLKIDATGKKATFIL